MKNWIPAILFGIITIVLLVGVYNKSTIEKEHWFMDKRFAYKEDGCLIYVVDTNTHKQYLCTKYGGIMEIE